ncbi:MAG TPA: competence protein CoiA family protein [Gammaproteobacteria bacterium]|nr:competence protein CoiA family protein [Gammaproteobacteria bacterium]
MKAAKIKLPFGLNENNAIVHIANVANGEKCNCICPDCKSPLIAIKGGVKQHHFRHKGIKECKGGLESAIHLAAKQMIRDKRQITLPRYVCTASKQDSKGHNHKESKVCLPNPTIAYFDSVQAEISLHGMKADILAAKEGTHLIIEIYYRHKVDDGKIEKIKRANISAIEINLSNLRPEDIVDSEAFWSYMNDPSHIEWLHNAKAHESVYPELVTRLTVKIEQLEKKYDALHERARVELAQDLRVVKMLRNKQHRANSIHELKKSFVWQTHGEGSHLSLEMLPNFLNLYVPDGDWIFSCDRRIWQMIIYHSFICNDRRESHFFVQEVVRHIKNYCNVPRCLERLQESAKYFPDLVPPDAFGNMPSPQETVRAYCNHLCDLGMLEFSSNDSSNEGNFKFKIIRKTPNAILI